MWRQIVWCGATSATVALMLPCSQIMIFMRFKTCPNLKQGLVNSTGQINRRRERRVVEDNSQSTRVIVSLVQDYLLGAGFGNTKKKNAYENNMKKTNRILPSPASYKCQCGFKMYPSFSSFQSWLSFYEEYFKQIIIKTQNKDSDHRPKGRPVYQISPFC